MKNRRNVFARLELQLIGTFIGEVAGYYCSRRINACQLVSPLTPEIFLSPPKNAAQFTWISLKRAILIIAISALVFSIQIAKPSTLPLLCLDSFLKLQATTNRGSQSNPQPLNAGQPIERIIKGAEVHIYKVSLESGQYLHITLDQKDIDLTAKLLKPDAAEMLEMNWQPKQAQESIWALAEVSGDYKLEIHPDDKQATEGVYKIKIEKIENWQDATPLDKQIVTAHKLFWEASKLRDEGTGESLNRATGKYQEALVLWREIKDSEGEANTLMEMGAVYVRMSQVQKALEHYLPALELWRRSGNRRDESQILINIGLAYWRLGDPRKGVVYLEQAVQISRQVGNRFVIGAALNGLASLYDALYERDKSLACYLEAVKLFHELDNTYWEAVAVDNVGLSYALMGESQKALEALNRALSLRRVAKDFRGEGYTLQHLGYVFEYLGEVQKARDYYGQALPLWRKTGDPFGISYSLTKLGLLYQRSGDLDKALDHYNQALPLALKAKHKNIQSQILSGLGVVYLHSGKTKEAVNYLEQGLALQREIEERQGEAYSIFNIGECYFAQNEPQRALEQYLAALEINQRIGSRASEAMVRYRIANVERDRGNFSEARKQIEAALAIIETLRTKIVANELRTSYFARSQNYYGFYIDILMQLYKQDHDQEHIAEALVANERARARSLLESLIESRANIRQGAGQEALDRERNLQRELNAKAQQQIKLLSGKHTEEQATEMAKQIEVLTREYDQVLAQIRQSSPRYAALTQPQPLTLKQIQTEDLDNETLLLEYALGNERSYLWAVTQTSVESFQLPKQAEIESLARHVYDLLTARNQFVKFEKAQERQARIAKTDAEYAQAADELSQMLLGPVANQMRDKRLLIVSDGALQYLSFAALPLPDASARRTKPPAYVPLITKHEVISLPSASTLAVLRRELAGRKLAPKTVAVLADPVFDKADERVKKDNPDAKLNGKAASQGEKKPDAADLVSQLTRSVRDFGMTGEEALLPLPRLPFTRQEAEAIVALTPANEHKQAIGFAACRAAALDPELSQYRYVHFATHGLLNSTHPDLSGIVLSLVDENGKDQNGFLLTDEIYNLHLPAELVVLSGCKTGFGKEIKGEGLLGLTRGFMYAGAARMVVSLWDVNDRSTAELMAQFYRRMLGKTQLRPAAALREAQVAMWKSSRWHAPYYWAAFVLQGEYH